MTRLNEDYSKVEAAAQGIILRDYQERGIAGLKRELSLLERSMRRVILWLGTGGGKTATLGGLILRAVDKGARVYFVADRLELVDQAYNQFTAMGLRCGIIQGQNEKTDIHRPVQVCSQATLGSWIKRGKLDGQRIDIVIHDECDVQYKVRDMLAEQWPEAIVIGLTATPFSKGLGTFYQGVVSPISMAQMIDTGYLSPYRIFAPSQPEMQGVKTSGGDWQADDAATRYNGELVADIVSTWKKHASDRRTLMFCCNVAHSKAMVDAFVQAGVNAVHVDGYPSSGDDEHRHSIIARYKSGDIQILSSVALCARGFDAPETSALIIARPTKSLSLYMQVIGRALRPAEGKTDAIILDHSGCALLHGYPEDITDIELDTGKKGESKDRREKGEPLPTPCPSCHFMKPPKVHRCPVCLFAPSRQNEVVNVDGVLVEMTKLVAEQERRKRPQYTQKDKDLWMRMLKYYEVDRGKKKGYSIFLYRDKFGVDPDTTWPRKLQEPSQECLDWIRSRNIRYAKSRQRQSA